MLLPRDEHFELCRDDDDDGWAIKAATDAIERLIDVEKTESHTNDEVVNDSVEINSENASETFQVMIDATSSFEIVAVTEEDERASADSNVAMEPNIETEKRVYDDFHIPEEASVGIAREEAASPRSLASEVRRKIRTYEEKLL